MTHHIRTASALILDMDGVIVDTEPLHVESFRIFLKRRNIVASENFLLALIGHSVEENMREIYRAFFRAREQDLENDVREREIIYLDLLQRTNIEPRPGLEDVIAYCKRKGIALALASSSIREQITTILDKLNIQSANSFSYHKVFSVIVSGEDVARKKPAPDIYLRALEQLGVNKSRCVAVEDSPAGVQAAKAAGIKCAAARTDYVAPERLETADAIISSLVELPALLERFIFNKSGA